VNLIANGFHTMQSGTVKAKTYASATAVSCPDKNYLWRWSWV